MYWATYEKSYIAGPRKPDSSADFGCLCASCFDAGTNL